MVVLAIKESGVSLGKTKEQFKLVFGGSNIPVSYVPATKVEYIIIDGNVNLSYGALELIREYTIPVIWPDYRKNGMLLQAMYAPGTVKLRENQYAARKELRGAYIATEILHSNITNKINVIKGIARNIKSTPKNVIAPLLDMEAYYSSISDDINQLANRTIGSNERNQLMGHEAMISNSYFDFINRFAEHHNWKFEKRSRRPAENTFNALLNYGYAILEGNIHRHLFCQGFDPYAGFIHADRAGRKSLSLDIIEIFRQRIDLVIIKLIASDKIKEDWVEQDKGEFRLNSDCKSLFITSIINDWKDMRRKRSLDQEISATLRSIHRFLIGNSQSISTYKIKVKDPW